MVLRDKKADRKPLDDQRIIKLYFECDENAIEETDFKYKNYLLSIAYNMVHDKLDCEECLNDTYLGAWNTMPPSRPHVLKAFLTTIMRRTAIKRYHRKTRQSAVPSEMTLALSELEEYIVGEEDVDAHFDAERLGRVISGFLRSLSDRRRFIFMSRYYASEPIHTIANDLGLSRSTVNKELAAIRGALKDRLESEGYSI